MRRLLAAIALVLAGPAVAQVAPPRPGPTVAAPRTILFVGNSFTQGNNSPVRHWNAASVADLNGTRVGGAPALFKRFTEQAGLNYAVSLETVGGTSLSFHYDRKRQLFDRAWDVVVLQEYSTLDQARPGDPTQYLTIVPRLVRLFRARNPRVQMELMATWSRADQAYRLRGPWLGKPIAAMAADLRTAADHARAATPGLGVLPVGEAWSRAFARGVADPDPYDGRTFGQIDLWSYDQYHASTQGYYLEALVVFGAITGVDPTTLGARESAAEELGLSASEALALQRIAGEQLAAEADRPRR